MNPLPRITRIGNGRHSIRIRKSDLEEWTGGPIEHEKQLLTLADVAVILGLSVKTLHNRLSAARKKGNP